MKLSEFENIIGDPIKKLLLNLTKVCCFPNTSEISVRDIEMLQIIGKTLEPIITSCENENKLLFFEFVIKNYPNYGIKDMWKYWLGKDHFGNNVGPKITGNNNWRKVINKIAVFIQAQLLKKKADM
jgi:hypothetical protein